MAQAKPVVLITRRLTQAVEDRLSRDYQAVFMGGETPPTSSEIVAKAKEIRARGLLVTPSEPMDRDALSALPDHVEIIATFSVGYDHIDIAAATERGIRVTNTPGVLTEATADIALLLMLGAARRAHEGDELVRSGRWNGLAPTQLLGRDLGGKRLGIVGMGRIGRALAHRARALGMEIHYHNRRPLPESAAMGATYHADAEELLKISEVLSLHMPATPETKKFLNAERIALLPRGAIVVNTARGVVIDDEAMIAALREGRLGAAGLDVFDGEPNAHPGYAALPNTFLLPHLGSATVETRDVMGFTDADNMDAHFSGGEPPNLVTL